MTAVTNLHALWLTAEPPDRSLGGGSIRQAHLLGALAATYDVTCVLYGHALADERSRALLHDLVEVPPVRLRLVNGRNARRVVDLTRAVTAKAPPEVTDFAPALAAMRKVVNTLPQPDAVLVEHPGLGPLVASSRGEPWLLTLHNIGSGTLEQQAALVDGRRRWLLLRQARQAREFEAWCLRSFRTVFTVSDEDAAMLPGPSVVVPNGVDLDLHAPTSLPAEPRVVLVGTLGYLPNADGAIWFVNHVWPLVRDAVPNAHLDLVGRTPTAAVLALARVDGVSVHADVPDVRPFVRAARVSIVPLRVGTGTRLKALESMAAARPVVGTAVGLAGLAVVDGEQALVAETEREFATAVVSLLVDDARAQAVAAAGRRLVETGCSWTQIGSEFVSAFTAAVSEARS